MATRLIIVVTIGMLYFLVPFTVVAQVQREVVPLKNWPAPLYWQPSATENAASPNKLVGSEPRAVSSAADITPKATTPVGALVFVAMTPCRVVDTRTGFGFSGPLGPPNLFGNTSRTFPIQSSTTCSIPSIAQAYSFNITVVPPGFLNWITVWPTGQPQPNASTLNGWVNTIIANAAIVPAGTNGSVDVFASQNTDLIIDINGYYAPQTGVTLAQGSASAPSLSFAGDPGTGIFSSAAGTLNIATGGTSQVRVLSNGDLDLSTNLDIGGNRVLSDAGGSNMFAGVGAGASNTGFDNSFFGASAGVRNTSGGDNSFFGYTAGETNSTGVGNAFFGYQAGSTDSNGSYNTAIGYRAGAIAGPNVVLTNSTAIGANAVVSASNSLVLGSIKDEGVSPGTNVGIGTTSPLSSLDVRGDVFVGLTGVPPFTGGNSLFVNNDFGDTFNSFRIDGYADTLYIIGDSGAGSGAGTSITFATAPAGGGETSRVTINPNGVVSLNVLGAAGTGGLCRNTSGQISFGSSSLRYKTGVETFSGGLDIVNRLRPIGFDWKESGSHDIGLAAEEVEQVEPLLTFRNPNGEIEGVKYNQLSAVFINAFKEQQAQIESQQNQIAEQQKNNDEQRKTNEQQRLQLDQLRQLVCLDHPQADVCR